jgi:uncharacterized protein (TIGR03435 family)
VEDRITEWGNQQVVHWGNGIQDRLSPMVQRIVTDGTGLQGNYDFDLTWAPEQTVQAPPGAPSPAPDPDSPSIFTALREQLGLKLQSARGPVDVIVIDRVERPTR